ncbi:EamA-like transporter family protein [Kribbella antiqua]|uniref:EamA-like transporter family protein n=1 Tax=Kribbella antiqua TaxID=2512217 RepID=A0A4V2S2Z0_9ACTN|nr:EamA family transporter [Kribbella antiqua]TCO42260.1 EamA-like transporter family protein [Kribbella antiqua]
MALFAWAPLAERPTVSVLIGAATGITGVCLMLGAGTSAVDLRGVVASLAAMTMSSCGYVLAKKWGRADGPLATTSWQLIAGGLVLIPFALVFEGAPPPLDLPALAGFTYVGLIATALAFTAWFTALRHLPAATVGLIGLLNPVTGVLLGLTLSADTLTLQQLAGLSLVLLGITLSRPRRTSTSQSTVDQAAPVGSKSLPARSPAVPCGNVTGESRGVQQSCHREREVFAMSEPTSAPDAIEHADASFWRGRDLEEIVGSTGPLSEDESFEIPDLTDDEWDRFVRAIHE